MSTYASNAEIQFDTGRSVVELLSEELTADEQQNVISTARERAFNTINSKLKGKTAVPAFHIDVLKQVEIDFVLSELLVGAYTLESMNQSEWAEKYSERAKNALAELYFDASVEEPIVYSGNVGDGTLKIISVFSEYAKEETWVFTALNATEFSVIGSVSGTFPTLTIDKDYPEKDWGLGNVFDYGLKLSNYPTLGRTPFICRINNGSVAFEKYDNFSVKMFASESSRRGISTGRLIRG